MNELGKGAFLLITFAIVVGIILTTLSWLGTCTEACAEGHKYTLFGMKFEITGFLFFISLAISHLFSLYSPFFYRVTKSLLAMGLGAEIYFIITQKFIIGAWCPLCLSIAATLLVASLPFIQQAKRGNMLYSHHKLTSLSIVFFGFIIAFFGMAKNDTLQAVEDKIEPQLIFGNKESPIEVYIFTSWTCPACKKLEPALEKMLPKIMTEARILFVDPEVDFTTLNFVPYNISFMLNEKPKYIQLRHVLSELSKETDTPTDELVSKAIADLDVKYKELSFADISVGVKHFIEVTKKFDISRIPAMVIVNSKTNQKQILTGSNEISESNVLATIEKLKKNDVAEVELDSQGD